MLRVCFNAAMRELNDAEIDEVLRTQKVAHVAVVDGDRPYVAPLSYVYADGVIAFRTKAGRRLDAIRANPCVSIEVTRAGDSPTEWSTVIVAGTAHILGHGSEAAGYVSQILAKYRAAYGVVDEMPDWLIDPGASVVRVVPDEVTGRAAADTRPGRL